VLNENIGKLLAEGAANDPGIVAITKESPELAARVDALVIDSPETLQQAAEMAGTLSRWQKFIVDVMRPVKQAIDESKKKVLDREKQLLELAEGPSRRLRAKMVAYQTERDRRQREEAARIDRENRQRAEEEKLERAMRMEALAKATGDEKLLKAVDEALDAPVVVAQPLPSEPQPKIKGASFRSVVSVEVIDMVALAKEVAEGRLSADALLPNMTWLKTEARQRGKAYNIPGTVRTESSDVTIRRS